MSLHVLHLFLQPIDRAFDLDNMPRDLGVVRFARDRVGLAQHLLRDEIQFSPCMIASAAGLLKCFQMMRQPLDFLANVRHAQRRRRHP